MIPDARDVPLSDLESDLLAELRAAAARIAHTNPVGPTARHHPGTARRRTVGSGIAAAGIAVTAAAGGYAAAAAAGVLPNPWAGPAASSIPFVTSPNPTGTVDLTVPGPESTTLEVITSPVTVGNGATAATGRCTGIVIKEPQGRTVHPMSACGGPSAIPAENAVFDWQAPSGTTFAIISGKAPAGAAKVALTGGNGQAAIEPTGNGYFVTYLPAREMPANGTLDFYDSLGNLVGSQNFKAH